VIEAVNEEHTHTQGHLIKEIKYSNMLPFPTLFPGFSLVFTPSSPFSAKPVKCSTATKMPLGS